MLKQILKDKGISVYKLAKEAHIPYTTVNEIVLGKKDPRDCSLRTIAAIADYLNIPIHSFIEDKPRKVASTWLDAKKEAYVFNIIQNTDLLDISRIHPLKQKDAVKIAGIVKNDKRIKQTIIFGSATNITCTIHSDIDIAIELNKEYENNDVKNEISESIEEAINYEADIIWLDHITKDSNIYENIFRGVII